MHAVNLNGASLRLIYACIKKKHCYAFVCFISPITRFCLASDGYHTPDDLVVSEMPL